MPMFITEPKEDLRRVGWEGSWGGGGGRGVGGGGVKEVLKAGIHSALPRRRAKPRTLNQLMRTHCTSGCGQDLYNVYTGC